MQLDQMHVQAVQVQESAHQALDLLTPQTAVSGWFSVNLHFVNTKQLSSIDLGSSVKLLVTRIPESKRLLGQWGCDKFNF